MKLTGYTFWMLFSLFCLAAFLVFWNVSRYNQEEVDLKQKLKDQLVLANSEVKDSIFAKVITIVNAENTGMSEFRIAGPLGELQGNHKIKAVDGDTTYHSFSLFADEEAGSDLKRKDTVFVERVDIQLTMDQSTKEEIDSTYIEITSLLSESDTSAFHELHMINSVDRRIELSLEHIFRRKLKNNNLPNQFSVQDKEPSSQEFITIPFSAHPTFKEFSFALFEDWKPYVVKRIIPSILMSILLFGLIALSFLLIYKSLNTQKKLGQMKSAFVSNMTHELKTPIATVKVALEALTDYGAMEDNERREEYLRISKQELNRLELLVDKVMNMSSFDGEQQKMESEQIDLKSLIDQTMKSMNLQFKNNGVNPHYEVHGSNFRIDGDKVHITNVLYNLLDNAIKYSDKNPQIELILSEKEKSIQLEVKDQGEGIEEEYHSKIFDRFFRIPTNNIHDVKGHGIGLHYVKEVLERHEGNIEVVSSKGNGSSFIIKLPKANG